jgi:hypothetical protein
MLKELCTNPELGEERQALETRLKLIETETPTCRGMKGTQEVLYCELRDN